MWKKRRGLLIFPLVVSWISSAQVKGRKRERERDNFLLPGREGREGRKKERKEGRGQAKPAGGIDERMEKIWGRGGGREAISKNSSRNRRERGKRQAWLLLSLLSQIDPATTSKSSWTFRECSRARKGKKKETLCTANFSFSPIFFTPSLLPR